MYKMELIKPTFARALRHFNIGVPQWYTWKDTSKDPDYSNLELYNDAATMPTEAAINAKLAELQAEYDAENATWKVNRKKEYKNIEEQLDMMYWDKVNGTTTWKDRVAKVKSDNPKS